LVLFGSGYVRLGLQVRSSFGLRPPDSFRFRPLGFGFPLRYTVIKAIKMPPTPSSSLPGRTSLPFKLLNIFVSPSDVFDEVIDEPIRPTVWLAPTLLVFLASLFLLAVSTTPEQISAGARHLVETERISSANTATVSGRWFPVSAAIIGICTLGGMVWSALILWAIARCFLKVGVSFAKALEVVGLAAMILVLGTIVTALLVLASGNAAVHPALSLLAGGLNQESTLRAVLDLFNLFYLWSTAVLAIGLSRLTQVSMKEACFWTFGYWVVLRISLLLLG